MLNARRHRDGDQRADVPALHEASPVLNARRHRDGDQTPTDYTAAEKKMCSTPEGIETVIRARTSRSASRPTVLNARRHRDGDKDRHDGKWRDAQRVLNARRHRDGDQQMHDQGKAHSEKVLHAEGIETVIECHRRQLAALVLHVLNARRHRDGDQLYEAARIRRFACAQRPKASRR